MTKRTSAAKRRGRGGGQARRPAPVATPRPATSTYADVPGASAEPAPLPRRDALALALTLALAFLVPFVVYLLTLAPTVTFEDSGELISAAVNWGIPHSPGYPLWTMLAHLFTWLPYGTVAWRVNLMSAFFSSLGAACVAWTTLLIIDELRHGRRALAPPAPPSAAKPPRRLFFPALAGSSGAAACTCALVAGLLTALARTSWEQSVITEVYGLNTFCVGLLLLLVVGWARAAERRAHARLFVAACFASGLALANHSTIILLLPALAVFAFGVEWRRRPSWRATLVGLGAFVVGLVPYLYLPIASSRKPILDWGDPHSWTTFWRVVTRQQYGTHLPGTGTLWPELQWLGHLIWQQWLPLVLLLSLSGLAGLFVRARAYGWLALLLLVVTGPLTTLVTGFPVASGDSLVDTDNKALVSVFYIPFYLVCALLAGVGAAWLGGLLAHALTRRREGAARGTRAALAGAALALVAVVLVVVSAAFVWSDVDMHRYRFADAYIHNVQTQAAPGSLVMVDRDQWGFPLMYAAMALKQRPDLLVVDQELLRRSWYIQMLRDHHPEVMAPIAPQVDAFLAAVAPFEAHQAYDGNAIESAYQAMIKALVDEYMNAGKNVYFTYQPPDSVTKAYRGESLGALTRVHRLDDTSTTAVDLSQLDLAHLTDGTVPLDRNVLMIRDYYFNQLAMRAQYLTALHKKDEAAAASALAQTLPPPAP